MKTLLIAFSLLLVAGSASAGFHGYMGIYFDNAHTDWCKTVAPMTPVTYWAWVLPGVNGVKGVVFMVDIDNTANIILDEEIPNYRVLRVIAGSMTTGMSAVAYECQTSWFWLAKQVLYPADSTPTIFQIVKHPAGYMDFANCLEDYPEEPFIRLTNGYLNGTCGPIATQEGSWGAIKALYR